MKVTKGKSFTTSLLEGDDLRIEETRKNGQEGCHVWNLSGDASLFGQAWAS